MKAIFGFLVTRDQGSILIQSQFRAEFFNIKDIKSGKVCLVISIFFASYLSISNSLKEKSCIFIFFLAKNVFFDPSYFSPCLDKVLDFHVGFKHSKYFLMSTFLRPTLKSCLFHIHQQGEIKKQSRATRGQKLLFCNVFV